jgi:hypothetical protein
MDEEFNLLLKQGRDIISGATHYSEISKFNSAHKVFEEKISSKLDILRNIAYICTTLPKCEDLFIEKKLDERDEKRLIQEYVSPPPEKEDLRTQYIEIKNIEDIKTPPTIFPLVDQLAQMPQCIVWGKKDHSPFVSFGKLIVKIPLPDISTPDQGREFSVKCKYKTRKLCQQIKKKWHSSAPCKYAHMGEKYSKIRYPSITPSNLSFGSHESLQRDIEEFTIEDIKILMFYTLSDLLLIKMWADVYIKDLTIFRDIDLA